MKKPTNTNNSFNSFFKQSTFLLIGAFRVILFLSLSITQLSAQIKTGEIEVGEVQETTIKDLNGLDRLTVNDVGVQVEGQLSAGSISTNSISTNNLNISGSTINMWPFVRTLVNHVVEINAHVDINTGVTWGASFGGTLTLHLIRTWNAGNRRVIVYNIDARGTELGIQTISDVTKRSPPTVSLSIPSAGTIRIHNTSGQPLKVSGWYDWVTAW